MFLAFFQCHNVEKVIFLFRYDDAVSESCGKGNVSGIPFPHFFYNGKALIHHGFVVRPDFHIDCACHDCFSFLPFYNNVDEL